MLKLIRTIAIAVALVAMSMPAMAASLNFYVDSAPNMYGSPSWAGWYDAAKADVTAGTFQNMRSGFFPGTLYADPLDMIVYSTGDLGKRLHWLYWLPGDRSAISEGRFQTRMIVEWDGVEYSMNADGSWAVLTPDNNWRAPSSSVWESTADGIFGSFGMAWWAADNDAAPFSTKGNSYDETDAADIQALRSEVFQYQNHVRGEIRYMESPTAGWEIESLQVNTIPEPSTFVLLGFGVCGIAAVRLRRR